MAGIQRVPICYALDEQVAKLVDTPHFPGPIRLLRLRDYADLALRFLSRHSTPSNIDERGYIKQCTNKV